MFTALLNRVWRRRHCYWCATPCHTECCSAECADMLDTYDDLMAMRHGC